jgi:hypothetical protein
MAPRPARRLPRRRRLDRDWTPPASSDDEDGDGEDDDEGEGGVGVQAQQPPHVTGEVFGPIYNGRVVRDDSDDMVNHVVSHYFQAADLGLRFVMPPELTEEEELAVAVLISVEEEKRAFPGIEDALALSVAPPPPPGPPPRI